MIELLTPEHIRAVCKIGAGDACCRYMTMSPQGLECAKVDPLFKPYLDKRVAEGSMNARGDNCEGRTGSVPAANVMAAAEAEKAKAAK